MSELKLHRTLTAHHQSSERISDMKYLCLALASFFFVEMPTLAMGTLSEIVCGIETPQPGRYYGCGVYPLRVFQVVSANGVIAHVDPRDFSSSEIRTMVYLRTNTSNMHEGMFIKGMYQCTGYIDYKTVLGASKRLPAFRELTCEESEKIEAEIRDARKREKEELLRREREAQPKRKEFAQQLFSRLDFDLTKHIYIDKALAKYAKDVKIEVEHFAWKSLISKCEQKDWIEVLNIVYDILHSSSDFTKHYEAFPAENEIKDLYIKLQRHCFSATWTSPKDIGVVANGVDTQDIMSSLKWSKYVGSVVNKGLLPFTAERIYLGSIRGKPYGVHIEGSGDNTRSHFSSDIALYELKSESVICDYNGDNVDERILSKVNNGKYVIPGMATVEAKRVMFACQLQSRKITQEEYKKKMTEVYTDFETALVKTFVKLSDTASIISAVKDMKDKETSDFIRQKKIVFDRISKMSFNIPDYVVVQESLLPYIHSAIIKERVWEELRKKHHDGDYMGMLKCIASDAKQFNENDIGCIYEYEKALVKKAFHLEIMLTHGIRMKVCGWKKSGFSATFEELHKLASSKDGVITVDFELGNANQIFVLEDVAPDPLYEFYRNVSREIHSVKKEVSYGNVSKADGKSKEASLIAEYKGKIASWMKTAKLLTNQKSLVKIHRSSPRSIGVLGISQRGKSSKKTVDEKVKPEWITCQDCSGTRYVSKGKCKECNGQGWYLTPVTRGIGGRPMGGRKRQCTKCNGKGEIKELCKECRGRGKIKQ